MGLTCAGKGFCLNKLLEIGMRIVEADMGDTLRHRKRSDPEFAKLISADQSSGRFCDNGIVNGIADEILEHFSMRPAIYLSGYPRNFIQFDHFMESSILDTHQVSIVHIDTPEHICLERALADARDRDDDGEEEVRQKFDDFYRETIHIIKRLKEKYHSFTFDGRKTESQIIKLVDALGLHDLIDLSQVSPEVERQFELWKIAEKQTDYAIDTDFMGDFSSKS